MIWTGHQHQVEAAAQPTSLGEQQLIRGEWAPLRAAGEAWKRATYYLIYSRAAAGDLFTPRTDQQRELRVRQRDSQRGYCRPGQQQVTKVIRSQYEQAV